MGTQPQEVCKKRGHSQSNLQIIVHLLVIGVVDAIAAGSLLYISLCEMTGQYFSDSNLVNKPYLRMHMTAALATGVLSMGIIALWA